MKIVGFLFSSFFLTALLYGGEPAAVQADSKVPEKPPVAISEKSSDDVSGSSEETSLDFMENRRVIVPVEEKLLPADLAQQKKGELDEKQLVLLTPAPRAKDPLVMQKFGMEFKVNGKPAAGAKVTLEINGRTVGVEVIDDKGIFRFEARNLTGFFYPRRVERVEDIKLLKITITGTYTSADGSERRYVDTLVDYPKEKRWKGLIDEIFNSNPDLLKARRAYELRILKD